MVWRYYWDTVDDEKNNVDFQQQQQIQPQKQLQPSQNFEKKKVTKDVEMVDLESISSKKSMAGGALQIGLFSANIEQTVAILDIPFDSWSIKHTIKFGLLVGSLVLQVL